MKLVKRQEFLRELESVASGLAVQEIVEQSTCFVFKDGRVFTYNEEIACSRASVAGLSGAVRAKPLLEILRKIQDDEIRVGTTDRDMTIETRTSKAGIARDTQVVLPIGAVETPRDDLWSDLDPGLAEAAAAAVNCVSTNENQFILTCVHLSPKLIEASDNKQAIRYSMETGLTQDVIIRGKTMKMVCQLAVTKISEGNEWVHFTNDDGLVVSCRRYLEEYYSMDSTFAAEGAPGVLPRGLAEAASRASVFSSENPDNDLVNVKIKKDRLQIKGSGSLGWYQQVMDVKYDGQPLVFGISPNLVNKIIREETKCEIAADRLIIRRGNMIYIAVLQDPNGTTE